MSDDDSPDSGEARSRVAVHSGITKGKDKNLPITYQSYTADETSASSAVSSAMLYAPTEEARNLVAQYAASLKDVDEPVLHVLSSHSDRPSSENRGTSTAERLADELSLKGIDRVTSAVLAGAELDRRKWRRNKLLAIAVAIVSALATVVAVFAG